MTLNKFKLHSPRQNSNLRFKLKHVSTAFKRKMDYLRIVFVLPDGRNFCICHFFYLQISQSLLDDVLIVAKLCSCLLVNHSLRGLAY
jgi:hypothetical protein